MPSCLPRRWLGDETFTAEPTCSCGLTSDPCEPHRRGCDRSLHPYLDEESLALVDGAVVSLTVLRGARATDEGAVLSVLASLISEAQGRLPDAVADARDRGHSWAEIATRLATSAPTLRRRYGDYVLWRSLLPRPEG